MDELTSYLQQLPNTLMDIPKNMPKTPQQLVESVNTVKMAPYFLFVHYTLVTLSLRARSGSRDYAKSHPFASWFVCLVSCLGGALISAFLLGKSTLNVFYLNNTNLIYITIVWYLVMFSPGDIFYKIVNINAVKAIILVLKEVQRVRNIQNGVNTVAETYRGSSLDQIFFVAVLIGSVRGSGAKFLMRPLDSFIRGTIGADNEFLKPTFSTKHAVLSSILILLQRMGYFKMDEPLLITILFAIAGTVQLALLFTDIEDPYKKIEEVLAAILFKFPDEAVKEVKKKKD